MSDEYMVIKIENDGGVSSTLLDVNAAKGMVDGFIRGGTAYTVVNGGIRLIHEFDENGQAIRYWDVIDTGVLHDEHWQRQGKILSPERPR